MFITGYCSSEPASLQQGNFEQHATLLSHLTPPVLSPILQALPAGQAYKLLLSPSLGAGKEALLTMTREAGESFLKHITAAEAELLLQVLLALHSWLAQT